jgi:tripartite-type tricarboxylate transporter receptor subunit TctC
MDFKLTMWRGVLAPKDTPPALIGQLQELFKKCMDDPEFKAKAKELSVDLKFMNAEELGKFMVSEDERYKNMIMKEKIGDRYK